jgi:hypothetical protein
MMERNGRERRLSQRRVDVAERELGRNERRQGRVGKRGQKSASKVGTGGMQTVPSRGRGLEARVTMERISFSSAVLFFWGRASTRRGCLISWSRPGGVDLCVYAMAVCNMKKSKSKDPHNSFNLSTPNRCSLPTLLEERGADPRFSSAC